ncbi:MAG: 2-amino-4-hydroxy-6-hydroxymethyldihydropteridine diphosphokinase [bacterium]
MTLVVLSLGSNIDREKNTRYAIEQIRNKYGELDISPVYETSSVGFVGPAFFNLIVGIHTDESLANIIEVLKKIESRAGRTRGPKTFDSRVLDIDVVLYGDQNFRQQGINVPRDEIEKYAYVLKPLSDIYPDLVHPVNGIRFDEMWQNFEAKDQTLFLAEFPIEQDR